MPALGFNQYDKFMAGVLLHNYSLPPQKLQFIATALYGFGSSKINSIGRIGYAIYPTKLFEKVVLSAKNCPGNTFLFFRKTTKQQQ